MNDKLKKIITITDLQPIKDFGLNVISEETRYAMFFTKKDGSETKAYSQFKTKGLAVGDSVEIAYTEEEREYEKEGEKKTALNRKIMWFGDVVTDSVDTDKFVKDGITIKVEPREEVLDVQNIPFN